jgi:putative transcriptional regulator
MPEQLDMVDVLIAQYVAGSLPEPARVLVESHLEMRPESMTFVSDLEGLAGEALDGAEPLPLVSRDDRLQAIFASTPAPMPEFFVPATKLDAGFPKALRDYVGTDRANVPWKTKLPGLKEHVIFRHKGSEATLLWARAGRALPNHTHEGLELTLVLEGAFHDHRGRFAPGDISVADESLDHRPVADDDLPCLCLSVLFAPLVYTGSRTRFIGDLIGF